MRKFDGVERYGKEEVENITNGTCYIFEKIDGANCSLYYDQNDGLTICSRNQIVWTEKGTIKNNFRSIVDYVLSNANIYDMIKEYNDCIFYGEWLVKHSISYPESVSNKIWFFDVYNTREESYFPYELIEAMFTTYSVLYVKPLAILESPTEEVLKSFLNVNTFLASPNQEGIVIKNYDYINRFGRQNYAKIVNSQFKEVNRTVFAMQSDCCKMGAYQQEDKWICSKCEKETTVTKVRYFDSSEEKIAEEYVQVARVKKILNKILNISSEASHDQFGGLEKHTSRILETTWYDVLTEDMHDIVKKYKYPIIDFKKFKKCVIDKTKTIFFELIRTKNV